MENNEVKSVYNFVPIAENVFFPGWANDISHDLPFADGESGTIRLKIESLSDIYVKDASLVLQDSINFNQHKKQYFIPGSSIKGEISTVLQALSFSKMTNIEKVKYAVRDLKDQEAYLKKNEWGKVKGAWLKKEDGEYLYKEAGIPGRISHKQIDRKFKITEFSKTFKGELGKKGELSKSKYDSNSDYHKSAIYKYNMLEIAKNQNPFGYHHFLFKKEDVMRKIYEFSSDSNHETKKGKLVFTGQPGVRKEQEGIKPSGKHYEFIFWETSLDEGGWEPVPEKVIENFKFVYFDQDTGRQSKDYQYWKPKLEAGEEVPIFYSEDTQKKIKHFGLSYLYKLPFEHSVDELMPDDHRKDNLDLNQCIFGYTEGEKALKGRVHIGHAFAQEGTAKLGDEKREILAGPRASYYPYYIKQDGSEGYKTFHNNSNRIRGVKRYPFRTNLLQNNGIDNDKIKTSFRPLKKGAIFHLDVHVHNLKAVELGAILSALTFHGNENCSHSIGMAKPLGYGRCKFSIEKTEGFRYENPKVYLKAFETKVQNTLGINWSKSEQLKELFAIASAPSAENNKHLAYPELKEFQNMKGKGKDKKFLKDYSEITKSKSETCPSYFNNQDIELVGDSTQENVDSFFVNEKRKLDGGLKSILDELLRDIETDLAEKIEKLEKENEAKRKAEKSQSAKLDFENVKLSKFDAINKKVDLYLKSIHGNNYSKNTELQAPLVRVNDFEALKEALQGLCEIANKKEQKKLANFQEKYTWPKVALWVGEEKAKEWFEELINNKA